MVSSAQTVSLLTAPLYISFSQNSRLQFQLSPVKTYRLPLVPGNLCRFLSAQTLFICTDNLFLLFLTVFFRFIFHLKDLQTRTRHLTESVLTCSKFNPCCLFKSLTIDNEVNFFTENPILKFRALPYQ